MRLSQKFLAGPSLWLRCRKASKAVYQRYPLFSRPLKNLASPRIKDIWIQIATSLTMPLLVNLISRVRAVVNYENSGRCSLNISHDSPNHLLKCLHISDTLVSCTIPAAAIISLSEFFEWVYCCALTAPTWIQKLRMMRHKKNYRSCS